MVEEEIKLHIGDGNRWTFFNGVWKDGPDGALAVPEEIIRQDGPGMQGHHYAFFKDAAFRDLRASFQFRLTSHSDVGLIFRAADPSHFYLLHFPCCGQANRAQHFWAALSKMDSSGYFKIIKLELVRRVPSNQNVWLDAAVNVLGDKVSVRVGEHGLFETSDATYKGPGRIGVFSFSRADIRNLVVNGQRFDAGAWDEQMTPRCNWSYPFPDIAGWQRIMSLVRTPGGDLLCYFYSRKGSGNEPEFFSSRSKDNGCTWSPPQALGESVSKFCLHRLPDGRLIKITRAEKEGEFFMAESQDDGYTWLPPETIYSDPTGLGQLLNLQDGSLLTFTAASYEPLKNDLNLWTWGSHHCQAFFLRSTDGGRTWSEAMSLDTPFDREGQALDGNLDLTEVSAVQMGDGRILALVRPIYSPWMWETWSSDGGVTWQPCVRGPFPGYATPNIPRTASGAILVAHRLPGLTIHTSLDDGHTWDEGTTIDSGLWAMGEMIEIEPNLILYIYNDSFERKLRTQFIRVTPGGLEPA